MIVWNRVTWYSKLSAVLFFILILPCWTFYIGRQYQKTIDILDEHNVRFIEEPRVQEQLQTGQLMLNQGKRNATSSSNTSISSVNTYPIHKNITATVFWVGEPVGGGSSEDNALSAWDDEWQKSYGGYDDYVNRNGYLPRGFTPKENPFYLDLPYNDFNDNGDRRADAYKVIPWAKEKEWGRDESMLKNRWVKLTKNGVTCYGQIEDAGPYVYDDAAYVFGTSQPKSRLANNAGMDVSPALRDCLKFDGLNNDSNKVDWQFIDEKDVPTGPWKQIITRSQINWN